MSLRALPLIAIAVILYSVVVLIKGTPGLDVLILHDISLPSKDRWKLSIGDLVLLMTLLLLFVELLKSTYTSTASLLDHGLSMLVFVLCLILFIAVPGYGTPVFFLILIATLIDVIAGYTIGIRVARRDLSIGANN